HDAAVGWGDLFDLIAQLVDGDRLADHLGRHGRALAQFLDLAAKLIGLQREKGDKDQAIRLERLFDVVVGAPFDGGDGGFDVAVTGDDHDGKLRIGALDDRQNFKTIQTASLQPDVEDDQLRPAFFDSA